MEFQNDLKYAQQLDKEDTLREYRKQFFIPDYQGNSVSYFCGNSLGLQPKVVKFYIEQELLDWKNMGVEGHLEAKNPWFSYHHFFESAATLVGAQKEEVVMMNSLTMNLHLMLASFYKNRGKRRKIVMESSAFPSDFHAVQSFLQLNNLDPTDIILELTPRNGEHTLRTEDIIATIDENRLEIAMVLLGGVNYYTGQLFDIAAITKVAKKAGAVVGWDLAHTVGNVPLQLHDWGVDFAIWCTYKYLNSGPGGVGGLFVHEEHGNNLDLPRMGGWWGTEEATRFQMNKHFKPQTGAAGWQVSNAPVFAMAMHKASLDIFEEAGMVKLRNKSIKLTGYLEFLLKGNKDVAIITPKNPEERGCQLSLLTKKEGKALFNKLKENAIIADWREPNVIRVAPVPLYNTFTDVYRLAEVLNS
jgi:kynureninase